jgi:hypothetical protein
LLWNNQGDHPPNPDYLKFETAEIAEVGTWEPSHTMTDQLQALCSYKKNAEQFKVRYLIYIFVIDLMTLIAAMTTGLYHQKVGFSE